MVRTNKVVQAMMIEILKPRNKNLVTVTIIVIVSVSVVVDVV